MGAIGHHKVPDVCGLTRRTTISLEVPDATLLASGSRPRAHSQACFIRDIVGQQYITATFDAIGSYVSHTSPLQASTRVAIGQYEAPGFEGDSRTVGRSGVYFCLQWRCEDWEATCQ